MPIELTASDAASLHHSIRSAVIQELSQAIDGVVKRILEDRLSPAIKKEIGDRWRKRYTPVVAKVSRFQEDRIVARTVKLVRIKTDTGQVEWIENIIRRVMREAIQQEVEAVVRRAVGSSVRVSLEFIQP